MAVVGKGVKFKQEINSADAKKRERERDSSTPSFGMEIGSWHGMTECIHNQAS